MKNFILYIATALLLSFSFKSNRSLYADDWPQWRGPNRDGVWDEKGMVGTFDNIKLSVKWRADVSGGYNSPTVANGKVFVMDRRQKPEESERALCFAAGTGKEIWSYSYKCKYAKVGYPAGPRAAVTIDGERAYSLGTMGRLICFKADNGEIQWQKDLLAEYRIKIPIWGVASSPIVYENLLIAQIGGPDNACIVAFDKITGRENWRALNDPASYSSPVIIKQAGKDVIIFWTGDSAAGLNPANGQVYWTIPFKPARMIINIADPAVSGNYVFLSGFYDGSMLIELDDDKPEARTVWRRIGSNERNTDSLHCCISTPLILGQYIYGVDSYGELRCLDVHTGDRIWTSLAAVPKARWANIHFVRNGAKIWMFNERGELIISTLSPTGYNEISRTKIINPTTKQLSQRDGVCWSHPAFADKCIYIRNDEELICIDLDENSY